MLIGQIGIIGHSGAQCVGFYVIMSALNKTVSYNRIKADNYREILRADRGDATTETWKSCAVVCGGLSVKRGAPEMCRVIF